MVDTEGIMATEEATGHSRGSKNRAEPVGGGITLGPEDQLVGKLIYHGDVRVQGLLEGEATLAGDCTVDADANAKVRLESRNLTVRGNFEGEAAVRERLQVSGSGIINGNVRVARLVIEDGAVLNGNVTMERPSSS